MYGPKSFGIPGIHIGQIVKILQIFGIPGMRFIFVLVHQRRPAFGANRNAVRRIGFDPVFDAAFGTFDDKNIYAHFISLKDRWVYYKPKERAI